MPHENLTDRERTPVVASELLNLPDGVRAALRYETDDGQVHDTVEAAQAHLLRQSTDAWQVGVSHYLMRLLVPGHIQGYLVNNNHAGSVVEHVAQAVCQNSAELADLLLRRPR